MATARELTLTARSEALWPLWSDGPHEYVTPIFFPICAWWLNFFVTETNRKCPRWAEFNSGAAPVPAAAPVSATSPPPMTPSMSSLSGFNRSGFGVPVPSPLATSPPVSAMEDVDSLLPHTPSGSAPKIKLTLKRS
jgi:hypothetical protein